MDFECCIYRYDIECHCYPDGCRTCVTNPYAVDDEEDAIQVKNSVQVKSEREEDLPCVRGNGRCEECHCYAECFEEREEED